MLIRFLHRDSYVYYQQRSLARVVRSVSARRKNENETNDLDKSFNKNSLSNIVDNSPDCNYLGIVNEDISVVHGQYLYKDNVTKTENLNEKFSHLINPNKNESTISKITWFGRIRLDSENIPKYHGQYDNNKEPVLKTLNTNSRDMFVQNVPTSKEIYLDQDKNKSHSKLREEFKIDEDIEIISCDKVISPLITNKINFRYSDEFRKGLKSSTVNNSTEVNIDDCVYEKRAKLSIKGAPKLDEETSISDKMAQVKLENEKFQDEIPKPEILSGAEYLKQIRSGKRVAHFKDEFDNLDKLIKKSTLDSKGFQVLKNQIPDYSKLTNDDILDILEKQILFNDCDIVAINKPYGISVHGSSLSKEMDVENGARSTSRVNSKFNSVINLNFFLPELAKRLDCSKLYTVHRIDRDTTGVLLLTKSQQKAKQLNTLFKQQRIEKKYLCITKNVPHPLEGIIDIPIELKKFKSTDGKKRERMTLCPEPILEARYKSHHSNTAKRAVTQYKVLSQRGNAALLEVETQTGLRHQIRVHLGFGLRCPILGDHKYTFLDCLAPQRLPSDILMALRVRQSKVRHIPMHLHAFYCMIPQAGAEGKNIFIRAPLPFHFRKNMQQLKLRIN